MKPSKFEIKCNKVAEETGIEVMFFDDSERPSKDKSPVEDDGNLHITSGSLRACFDVGIGQSASGKIQNENARKVLAALGIKKFSDDRVMVDETEDDDDECPCCGRGRHD